MNILLHKSSCPYELVYNQLPIPGPHTRQLLLHHHDDEISDTDDEGVWSGGGVNNDIDNISACIMKYTCIIE